MSITALNKMTPEGLLNELETCCAATTWATEVCSARPFSDEADLLTACQIAFDSLSRVDWLEAFAAHPQIGDIETLEKKFAHTAHLASGEQSGAAQASRETLEKLAQGNREYLERFGYIFIVFATGKSADEMLTLLLDRIDNNAEAELTIAAEEQKKITLLRLRGMLETLT